MNGADELRLRIGKAAYERLSDPKFRLAILEATGATVYTYPAETTHHDEAPFLMHFPEWYVVVPPLSGGHKWIPPGVRPREKSS